MKHITTFLNENTGDMCYKQILTYTISDDETRLSFEDLLTNIGFKDMQDQSTWALPFSSTLSKLCVINRIVCWSRSKDVVIDKKDFVQIFRAIVVKGSEDKSYAGIDSRKLVCDLKTKGLK